MVNTAQAQSTSTPYQVTLTDPSGHQWFADEPTDKVDKIQLKSGSAFIIGFRSLHYNYTRDVCKSQRHQN